MLETDQAESGWDWSQNSIKQAKDSAVDTDSTVLMLMMLHTPVHSSGIVIMALHSGNGAGHVNFVMNSSSAAFLGVSIRFKLFELKVRRTLL
jgi:hypothetical protein